MSSGGNSAVLQRSLNHAYPLAVSAEGHFIVDSSGKRYFDASGGAAVSCLGHGNEKVVAALCAQAKRLDFAHTAFFTNAAVEELASFLCSRAPRGLSHAYFCCGGSEAMEAAFKIAHQYYQERGEGQRRWVITRAMSYHGSTLGALSFGWHEKRSAPFRAILLERCSVSACNPYRGMREGENSSNYVDRLGEELEQKILELGADSVVAFAAETVSGSSLGAMAPPAGYWTRMREVCDRHGILLILDEVMCGSGRTGYQFACLEDGVAPDLLAVAKGLGGGVQPIGATLVAHKIVEAMKNGSGVLRHGHTYMGHPLACTAALAVQRVIEEEGLLERVRTMGEVLRQTLHQKLESRALLSAHIGDIRGRGLFRGLELVASRGDKTPFPSQLSLHLRVKACAMARGLICFPSGGSADGHEGDHVLLAPPFTISREEIDWLVETLYDAIEEAIDSLDKVADEGLEEGSC